MESSMEAEYKSRFNIIEGYLKAIVIILAIIAVLIGHQAYQYYRATSHYQTETFNKVADYLDRNDNKGLLIYAEKVLFKDPEDADALWGKAVALFRLKRYQESKTAFYKVKEVVPQWSDDVENYLNIINEKM
jgi:tetratricopeptide (TPR) repeat protein